jgi:hypothetical protein
MIPRKLLIYQVLRGLWVLNVRNLQEIQSGYYLLHNTFSEYLTIFDEPTLHSSIDQKTVLKLLAVKKCGALRGLYRWALSYDTEEQQT